jgi:hypothetical protein
MPGVLPNVVLAQGLAASFLTDTCRIARADATASDDAGGASDTNASDASVACAVVPHDALPSEDVAGDRLTGEMRWDVLMPAGTDVAIGDQVVVTTQGDRTLEVIGVAGPRTIEVLRKVRCTEVT